MQIYIGISTPFFENTKSMYADVIPIQLNLCEAFSRKLQRGRPHHSVFVVLRIHKHPENPNNYCMYLTIIVVANITNMWGVLIEG